MPLGQIPPYLIPFLAAQQAGPQIGQPDLPSPTTPSPTPLSPGPSPLMMQPPPSGPPIPGQPPIPLRDPNATGMQAPGKKHSLADILKVALPALGTVGLGAMAAKQGALSEALGGLAQGFAQGKLGQIKQKREQQQAEENRNVDLAHNIAIKELADLSPDTVSKYPKLQSLASKYRESLANDKMISPKEAAEIIVEYHAAQGEIAQAKQDEVAKRGQEEANQKQQFAENAQIGSLQRGMEAQGGLGMLTPEEYKRRAAGQFYEQQAARQRMSAPVQFEGEEMPRAEALKLRLTKEAEDARARAAGDAEANRERRAGDAEAARDRRQQAAFGQQLKMMQTKEEIAANRPAKLGAQDKTALTTIHAALGANGNDGKIAQLRALVEKLPEGGGMSVLGSVGSSLRARAEGAKYAAGVPPSKEYQQLLPIMSWLKANMTGPYLHGIRNQEFVKQIQQHMPNAMKDSKALMLEKLDALEDILGTMKGSYPEAEGYEESLLMRKPPLPSAPPSAPPVNGNPYR